MPAIGGSVEKVSIAGRKFAVAADADPTINLGGDTNEVLTNGDGTARLKKTKEAWMVSGLVLEMDTTAGDLEFLQDTADSKGEFKAITMTLANGTIYNGSGQILEKPEGSAQNATAAVSLGGPGKLSVQ